MNIYGKLILQELRNIRNDMKEEIKKLCNEIQLLHFRNEKEAFLLRNSENSYCRQEKNIQLNGNNFMENQPCNFETTGGETNVCCSEPVPAQCNALPVVKNDYCENMFEIPSLVNLDSDNLHHFSLASYSNPNKTDQQFQVKELIDLDSNAKTKADRLADTFTYPFVCGVKSLCESPNCDFLTTPNCIDSEKRYNKPEDDGNSFPKKVKLTRHTGRIQDKTDQQLLIIEQVDLDSNAKTKADRQADTSTYSFVFGVKSLCESSNCDSLTPSTPNCINSGKNHNKPEENGKSFTKKVNLTQHTGIHSRKKLFKCHICTKSFSRKRHLDVHTRSHTGEKPFICDVCNKGFSDKSNLNRHARVHTGEKPFKCDICEKSFSQKMHLTVHNLIHSRKIPYKCGFCKKDSAQNRI